MYAIRSYYARVNLMAAYDSPAETPVLRPKRVVVVGGNSFMPLIDALRQGGRYSTSGAIAGPLVEFDLRQLVYKDLQLTSYNFV